MLCAVNEAIQETCRFSDMAAISVSHFTLKFCLFDVF